MQPLARTESWGTNRQVTRGAERELARNIHFQGLATGFRLAAISDAHPDLTCPGSRLPIRVQRIRTLDGSNFLEGIRAQQANIRLASDRS